MNLQRGLWRMLSVAFVAWASDASAACYGTQPWMPELKCTENKDCPRLTVADYGYSSEPRAVSRFPFKTRIVYFATNRHQVESEIRVEYKDYDKRFENVAANDVVLGWATISIPRDHRRGQVETPWLNYFANPVNYFTVVELDTIKNTQDLLCQFEELLGGEKPVSILVHGIKNTFTDAAFRAAQLLTDAIDSEPVLFFSWPASPGYWIPLDYSDYVSNARDSMVTFSNFLGDLLSSKQLRLNLLGHSQGANFVLNGLSEISRRDPDLLKNVDVLALAHPDTSIENLTILHGELLARLEPRAFSFVSDDAVFAWKQRIMLSRQDSAGLAKGPIKNVCTTSLNIGGHDALFAEEYALDELRKLFSHAANKTLESYVKIGCSSGFQQLPKSTDKSAHPPNLTGP